MEEEKKDVVEETKTEEKKAEKRRQEKSKSMLLRVLISVVIIAVGIYIILWAVAKASLYDSIGAMLQHMWTELGLMWDRITA